MPSRSVPEGFWILFPFLFIGMWMLVSFTISLMGRRSFSTRYPAPSRPPGRAYGSPGTRFAGIFASYRNVVRVVFTDQGVYLYTILLFRPFHAPFLVPWASVRRVQKVKHLFCERYRLDIEDAAGEIHVVLPTEVEQDLVTFRQPA